MDKYDVFYSHAEEDENLREMIKAGIEALDLEVYVHEYAKGFGEDTIETIKNAICNSEYFVVTLTDNALKSQWVQQEIGYAQKCLDDGEIEALVPIRATKKHISGFISNTNPIALRKKGKHSDFEYITDTLLEYLIEEYGIKGFTLCCEKCGEDTKFDFPEKEEYYDYEKKEKPMELECDSCEHPNSISPLSLNPIKNIKEGRAGIADPSELFR